MKKKCFIEIRIEYEYIKGISILYHIYGYGYRQEYMC